MLFNKSNESRLDKLENKVKELEALLAAKSCCRGPLQAPDGTLATSAGSSAILVEKVSQKASYEMIDFKTSTGPSGIGIEWNLDKFQASLPAGHSVRDVRVVMDTNKSTIVNSNNKAASIIVGADAVNPQAEVRIKIDSPDGLYRYDKTTILDTTTDGDKTISLDPTVPKVVTELSRDQIIDNLMSRISMLESK